MFSRILLASRPDVDGESAALPALALALKTGARLRVLEWGARGSLSLRDVLTRWKILPEGSDRSALPNLGLAIKKRTPSCAYSVNYLASEARARECDLVVFSSLDSRSWLSRLQSRWLGNVPGFDCCCLVTPSEVRGLVDAQTGEFQVSRVLCCGPETRSLAASVSQWLKSDEPTIEDCQLDQCWSRARELPADLVVLSTSQELNPEFLEKLLPLAPCPVLLLPR